MDIRNFRCMGHVSTSNHGSACAGCTQHDPFPMVTPAQGKEGFWDYVRVHVCGVAAYGKGLFLSWPLTFGDNYWKGRDYQFVQGFSFKLCRSWLNRSICFPAFLGPCCVCVGGLGMVEGAVKPHALSRQMEKCSLAQSWELGGKIEAERDIAEVRRKQGSLHPRKGFPFSRGAGERGSGARAKLSRN